MDRVDVPGPWLGGEDPAQCRLGRSHYYRAVSGYRAGDRLQRPGPAAISEPQRGQIQHQLPDRGIQAGRLLRETLSRVTSRSPLTDSVHIAPCRSNATVK